MNKAQIIDVIAKDGEYIKACKSIAKNNYLADDLYQELMVILLEYNEDKLILIWEQKRIKWFIISILLKMCHFDEN
jgi:DNA-directed RNA polymerase specialized sigma24 family protein